MENRNLSTREVSSRLSTRDHESGKGVGVVMALVGPLAELCSANKAQPMTTHLLP